MHVSVDWSGLVDHGETCLEKFLAVVCCLGRIDCYGSVLAVHVFMWHLLKIAGEFTSLYATFYIKDF